MRRRVRDLVPKRARATLGGAGRGLFAAVAGPLQRPVAPGSVIAICHCHHADLVPEIATRMLGLPSGAELHVSSSRDPVLSAWERYRPRSRATIALHSVENRGRDLLPFFEVARRLDLAPDAAVLKIHGKRSEYSDQGDWWRRDSLRGLFPGPFAAHRALGRFAADPRLALIGAPGSFISNGVYWGQNRPEVSRLMREICGRETTDADLGFIAGSMFWIRGGYLSTLLERVEPDRFAPEPLARDGTWAHAWERVIGMAALAQGWHIVETGHPGPLSRDEVRDRTVPYF